MKKLLLPFSILAIIAIIVLINKEPNKASDDQSWNKAAEFWRKLRADPITNEIDPSLVQQARLNAINMGLSRSGSNINWVDQGPTNFGGRTRAILFDKTVADGSKVYAGSATGGLFVSYNEGGIWAGVPGLPSIPVSAMAQHPDGSIYVGTGSAFESPNGRASSGKIGSGIYKFDPNNESGTFHPLPSAQPTIQTGNLWTHINALEIDQTTGRIYAATIGGLKYSDDDGNSWQVAKSSSEEFYDVIIADDGTIIASERLSIYKSTTGNPGSFTTIYPIKFDNNGVSSTRRMELAFAPSDNNFVYVVTINASGEFGALYQSKDKGDNWLRIMPDGDFHPFISRQGQGFYDAFLAVDPVDPEKILIGGVELWMWDGDFTQIVSEDPALVGGMYSGLYMHADKHCFAYSHANPDLLLVGNDGGISKSLDAAGTFYPANRGYNVAQFYSVATDRFGNIMGGTQDNGTILVDKSNPNFPLDGKFVLGGDGFRCAMSSISNMTFATVYEGQINRGNRGNPMAQICGDWNCADSNFYTSIALYESLNDNTSKDFISFKAEDGTKKFTLLSTNGIAMNFSGNVNLPQTSSKIVSGSIRFVAGNQILTDAGNGQLTGDGSGSFDYSTLNYNLSFKSAPTNGTELKAYFDIYYNAGDEINLSSNTTGIYRYNQPFTIKHTLNNNLNPGDSVLIKDPVQSLLAYGGDSIRILRGALNISKPAEWLTIPLEKQIIKEDFTSVDFTNWPLVNGSINNNCGLNSTALLFDGSTRSIESSPLNLGGNVQMGFDVYTNLNCNSATINDTIFVEFSNNNTSNNWVVLSKFGLGGTDERISLILPSGASVVNTKVRIRQGTGNFTPGNQICAIDNILFTKSFNIDNVKCMEFSNDGDHLFIGTMNGRLIRVSGLNDVYTKLDALPINNKISVSPVFTASTRVITGIGVHPHDDDQLIFTLGNYGSYTDYIYYTNSATTQDTTTMGPMGDFQSLQLNLPQMPVYDAIIANDVDQTIILGTDQGVFCANLNDLLFGQGSWQAIDPYHPLFGVPIFEIAQQTRDWSYASNHGKIYLGTHGRGFWATDNFVGIEIPESLSNSAIPKLKLYPNPSSDVINLEFQGGTNELFRIKIVDLSGQLVKSTQVTSTKGDNLKTIDISNLSEGQYLLIMDSHSSHFVNKFIAKK